MSDESAKPATKADISLLRAELATKAEILATTDELRATTTELQASTTELRATTNELREEMTRMNKKIDRVALELVNTQADVREIKHDMATKMATKDDIGRVLNAIDAFAKKSENQDKSVALHGHVLTQVQVDLKDHAGRLATLESARP